MVYLRSDGSQTYLVAVNPTSKKQTVTLSRRSDNPETVLSSGKAQYRPSAKGDRLSLWPVSAVVIKI